ncbi:EpsG family protein [Acinetobacter towneri]|uniref:EpsG family protein n=1 Tax=Acinetobacter towneri TaxID=202956 RepID=UPI00336BBCAE
MPTVIFYCSILLFSTLFIYLRDKGKGKLEYYFFTILAFLLVFIPSAIRYEIGADYLNYKKIYLNIDYYNQMEFGFYYINYFLNNIGSHYQWSFVVFAFLYFLPLFLGYPKRNAWIIHFLFGSFFYLLSFFYVRSAIAVGFCFLALHFLLKNRFNYFLLFVFIGSLFHVSALFVGLVGLLSFIPTSKFFKHYIFPVISIFLLIFIYLQSNVLFGIMEKILFLLKMEKYAGYFSSTKWMDARNLGSGIGVLAKVIFSVYYIFNTKNAMKYNDKNWAISVFLFLYAVGVILSAQIVIFGRLAYMFIFAMPYAAFVLWNLTDNIVKCNSFVININRLVVLLFAIMSLLFYIKDGFDLGGNWGESLFLNPYRTIFSKNE